MIYRDMSRIRRAQYIKNSSALMPFFDRSFRENAMRKTALWLYAFASFMTIALDCHAEVQGPGLTPQEERSDMSVTDKLFPPVPKFLADELNLLLSLVVEYGGSEDNIAKDIQDIEKTNDFKESGRTTRAGEIMLLPFHPPAK